MLIMIFDISLENLLLKLVWNMLYMFLQTKVCNNSIVKKEFIILLVMYNVWNSFIKITKLFVPETILLIKVAFNKLAQIKSPKRKTYTVVIFQIYVPAVKDFRFLYVLTTIIIKAAILYCSNVILWSGILNNMSFSPAVP